MANRIASSDQLFLVVVSWYLWNQLLASCFSILTKRDVDTEKVLRRCFNKLHEL